MLALALALGVGSALAEVTLSLADEVFLLDSPAAAALPPLEARLEAGLDPAALIEVDRTRARRDLARAILDVQPADTWGPLTALEDPSGLRDARYRTAVLRGGQRVSGETFPPTALLDLYAPGLPEDRAAPARSEVVAWVSTEDRGWRVGLEVEARITVEAVGRPDIVRVAIPRYQSEAPGVRHEAPWGLADPEAWALHSLTLEDGAPVRWRPLSAPDAPWQELQVLLPRPLEEGEALTLRAAWSDSWPLGRIAVSRGSYVDSGGGISFTQVTDALGSCTGLNPLSPMVGVGDTRPRLGAAARVGVPIDDRLQEVLTADTTRRWREGGWRWVESGGAVSAISLALGPWRVTDEAPAGDLPGVRVLARRSRLERAGFAAEVRRVAGFFSTYLLPSYPLRELEVFEHAERARTVISAGVLGISPAEADRRSERRWRQDNPYYEHRLVSQAVAYGYWDRLHTVNDRDRWMSAGLSELYAGYYLRAAFGEATQRDRLDAIRRDLQQAPAAAGSLLDDAALTRAADPTATRWRDYAHYVLARLLPQEIPLRELLAGLDRLLSERGDLPVTTEHLQAALEASSGGDLEGFFRTWIDGGPLPALSLTLDGAREVADGVEVRGTVRSSVPFGRLRAPVELRPMEGGGARFSVEVVDGEGRFTRVVPGRGAVRGTLDPEGLLPVEPLQARASVEVP
jgi:hypothetical protein